MTFYSEEAYIVSENTMRYAIKVEGCLDDKWTEWFEGMTMRYNGKMTILEGIVKDQAHLHGLLAQVRDLNLTLISVERLGPEEIES
jgi:hypothetical protein